MRRLVRSGCAVAALAIVVPAGVAHADPAEPTDYATVVVGIEPETPTISVEPVGGDSFVELTAEPGTEVVVLGYWGEPYLRFNVDGSVEENRRSPTVVENESRYGRSTSGSASPADGATQWVRVADDGSYAWHDHRAHWMSEQPPAGERGEQVMSGAIPLRVDGADVRVSVAVLWESKPSPAPVVAGAVVGAFAVMIVLSARYRIAWAVILGAAAAGAIGWWQVVSVPSETGPSSISWLLPAVAGVAAVVAVALGRSLVSYALVALAGLQLALWVFVRRDGLTRALLPTDAPFWLDRGVTTAAGVIGICAIVAGAIGLTRLPATSAP